MPYCHLNYKSCYDLHQSQEENKKCSSYIQTSYNIEKEQRQYWQLFWNPKMRSSIRLIDHQTLPMKVDLGWITPQKMKHISSGLWRLYWLVSSSIAVPSSQHHENPLRTREQSLTINYALRTKQV